VLSEESAPLHTMDDVALSEQKFSEIGTVVAGNTRDQRDVIGHQIPPAPVARSAQVSATSPGNMATIAGDCGLPALK
jgi:hypothetical protein